MSLKIGVSTLFTPTIAELHAHTCVSKIAYCHRWKYSYLEHEGLLCDRPASWSKLLWLGQNLANFDWLWWVDADAEIRNPSISLESLLDDQHDFIVAKENLPDYAGVNGVNLGSFFIRNTPWSHDFLRLIFSQTEFIDHFCWEQAAFDMLYRQSAEVRAHVRVDFDARRYNSFVSGYRKGDFVFHAIVPFGSNPQKMNLLERVAEEDQRLDFEFEPDIVPLLVLREETSDVLRNYTVQSLSGNPHAATHTPAVFLNQRDAGFSLTSDRAAAHLHWFDMVHTSLKSRPAEILLLVNHPIYFGQLWQRSLLLALASNDMAFSVTGACYDPRLLLFRNSPQVVRTWETLRARFQSQPYPKRTQKEAIAQFFSKYLPGLLQENQIRHTALESEAITSRSPRHLGLDATSLRLLIAIPDASPQEIAEDFDFLRHRQQQFARALLKKCYQARRPPEAAAEIL